MGDWSITVHGTGCHHNSNSEIDADLATQQLVETLLEQGHTIREAKFTYGGFNDMLEKITREKVMVIVNARRMLWPAGPACYAKIVMLAGETGIVRLVAYRYKDEPPVHRVAMIPGDTVVIEKGMIFDISNSTPGV